MDCEREVAEKVVPTSQRSSKVEERQLESIEKLSLVLALDLIIASYL